jgi:maleylpyruvate isomerase
MTDDLLSFQVGGILAGHRRLAHTLESVTEAQLREPSVLPDWTRGHVLAHIARNGDAVVRMLDGALRDEVVAQYPGGDAQRAADIETSSKQGRDVLIADVLASSAAVDAVLERMTPLAWDRLVGTRGGPRPARLVARGRWREVEIHHVDLGLAAYTPADWPADFVRINLADQLGQLAGRLPEDVSVHCGGKSYGVGARAVELDGPDHALLAWLVGRPQLAHGLAGTPPELTHWG